VFAQLYKDAGVPTKSFMGVPVFQAEGLTVTTQDMVRVCRQLLVWQVWVGCAAHCLFGMCVLMMLRVAAMQDPV
jgi:hypothetical protein